MKTSQAMVVLGVLVLCGCSDGREEGPDVDVGRSVGALGVTHTVCPADAPTPCDFTSPHACSVGAGVTNGDICLVLGGEYHETVTYVAPGLLRSGLIFRCAPGYHCLIDGDGVRDLAFDGYDDWVIEGFEITNTRQGGITGYRRVAGVRDCYIHDVYGRGIDKLSGNTAAGITAVAERNVVVNTGNQGIVCLSTAAGPIVIRNNLVIDASLAGGNGIHCSVNAVVQHNTVDVRNRTAPYANPIPYGINGTTLKYNVVAGGNVSFWAQTERAGNLAFGWVTSAYGGPGTAGVPADITGDPGFFAPEDYHLLSASPAVEAGTGSTEVEDLEGTARAGTPDLGAYEYVPGHTSAPRAWPVRETVAVTGSSQSMALLPSGVPVAAWLDAVPAVDTLNFAQRQTNGTWRGELIHNLPQTFLPSGTDNVARRLAATAAEPGTGLPVVAWIQPGSNQLQLRYARRVGDACGAGCTSIQWSGCNDTPIKTFTNSSGGSLRLDFNPQTGRPAIALWLALSSGCGTSAGYQVVLLEQQAGGSWDETLVDAGACGSNYIPPGLGFGFNPASGEPELVYSRTTGAGAMDVINAVADLVVATRNGATFTKQTLAIGAGNYSGSGNYSYIDLAHRPNGDLSVVFQQANGVSFSLALTQRLGGVWDATSTPLHYTGVRGVEGISVEHDSQGKVVIAFAGDDALFLARQVPASTDPLVGTLAARWDMRVIDTQKTVGFWPSLVVGSGDAVLVASQQEVPNHNLKFQATAVPGGLDPSFIDPAVCDLCPADPLKTTPGACGCGYAENPVLSIGDAMVAEGQSGSVQLTFSVTLSQACGSTVTVDWAAAAGTATAGVDYATANGTLSFAPDETQKTVTVTVFGDAIYEPNETVLVTLSNPGNAGVSDAQAVGTIVDDDKRPNGDGCSAALECGSGFCVEGVCCDTACGGGAMNDCQACTVAAGAAVNGTCGATTGNSCSDSDACTQSDTCQAGTCTGSNPVVCAASDQCHSAGTCDPSTGACSNPSKVDGTSCSDSDACTQSDTCQAGTCTGSNPVVCAASDQCHSAGTCDPSTGACSNPSKADGTSCSDSDACTQSDTCQAGTCTGSNPVVCAASDQCHSAGTCDPSTGACSNPSKADGTSCSGGTCVEGLCQPSNTGGAGGSAGSSTGGAAGNSTGGAAGSGTGGIGGSDTGGAGGSGTGGTAGSGTGGIGGSDTGGAGGSGTGGTAGSGSGGVGGSSTGGTGGSSTGGTGGSSTGGTAGSGTGGAGGAAPASAAASGDQGGCGCRTAGSERPPSHGAVFLLLLGIVGARRRRAAGIQP